MILYDFQFDAARVKNSGIKYSICWFIHNVLDSPYLGEDSVCKGARARKGGRS